MNISGVGEMGVDETGVGGMGQIIGETGVGEMGVGETGTSHQFQHSGSSFRHEGNFLFLLTELLTGEVRSCLCPHSICPVLVVRCLIGQ